MAKKLKPTPGPWMVAYKPEYDGERDGTGSWIGGATGAVEYDRDTGVFAVIDGEPETIAAPWDEADARLIAAAPDLLAACLTAVQSTCLSEAVLEKLDAAIKKATGE